jgi:hypothetical protein
MRVVDAVLDCRLFILKAVVPVMEQRSLVNDDWIRNERLAFAVAANQWAMANGYSAQRTVTVADVERIEVTALGHVDYAPKLALRIAEYIVYGETDHG